jgi:hypothetical protein
LVLGEARVQGRFPFSSPLQLRSDRPVGKSAGHGERDRPCQTLPADFSMSSPEDPLAVAGLEKGNLP